jgi:hypothetical protein
MIAREINTSAPETFATNISLQAEMIAFLSHSDGADLL